MIPIRDTIRSRKVPILVYLIIFLNSFFFLFELMNYAYLNQIFKIFGFVPRNFFFASYPNLLGRFIPLFTSMFLHGGFIHFIGNMLFLWVFGDNVEDRLGKIKFLMLYFGSGIFAAILQGAININSNIPMIGASGAIAGVLGAYFLLFPFSRILTIIPIFIYPLFVEIPAPFFLFYWFIIQFFNGTLSIAASVWTQVAFWAHVGGFIFGLLFTLFFSRKGKY